ncbi:MAG: zinc-dependent metalloprotease [Bacteroidota bacterium]
MRILWTLLLSGLFALSLPAQQELRQYTSMEYQHYLGQTKSAKQSAATRLEKVLNGPLRFEAARDVTIPVVFHVLYADENEKVSLELLQKQLEILNEDFADQSQESYRPDPEIGDQRNLGEYLKYRRDTRIRFCFPNTSSSQEVVKYSKTNVIEWTDFLSMKEEAEGSLPWNTAHYLNVWICKLPDDNAGFAQMPYYPKEWDGVVIDYRYVQNIGSDESPYNAGHTLTHLVGNYLGLYPLWGSRPCSDDYVDDTPIHNSPNVRCESINHISTCSGNPTEMINNFMDNTHDACLNMFTRGQMLRMQGVLQVDGPRGELGMAKTQCDEQALEGELTELPEGFSQPSIPPGLRVFPNPVVEEMVIDFRPASGEATNYQIQLFSISGQLLFELEKTADDPSTHLDMRQWSSGMYFLNVRQGSENFSQKIIVK